MNEIKNDLRRLLIFYVLKFFPGYFLSSTYRLTCSSNIYRCYFVRVWLFNFVFSEKTNTRVRSSLTRNFFPVKIRGAERENCTRYVSRWMLLCFVYKVDHSPAKVAARDMRFNCLTQLRSVAVESCPGFGNESTPSARRSSQLGLTAIYFIDFYSQKNIMSFCVFLSLFSLFPKDDEVKKILRLLAHVRHRYRWVPVKDRSVQFRVRNVLRAANTSNCQCLRPITGIHYLSKRSKSFVHPGSSYRFLNTRTRHQTGANPLTRE